MKRTWLALLSVLFLSSITFAQTSAPATAPTTQQVADEPATKVDAQGKPNSSFMQKHEKFVQRAKQGDIDLLFLGDSITEQWGSKERGADVWKKHYADAYKVANFGIGGDRTQHVLWRIENGELDNIHPKVIVLLIGTNNTASDPADKIAAGIERIVKECRQKTAAKVLLLAIFPRGETPADQHRPVIAKINEQIKMLDDGKNVRFKDIGNEFLQPDMTISKEIMPDYLHLTPKGYELWADAIDPLLKEMMGS